MSTKPILPLLFGILLGMTLSAVIFYPNKTASYFSSSSLIKAIKSVDIKNSKERYNHSMADDLSKSIRVLCWILTTPENHDTKVIHVKNTWGKRCNKILFMSTHNDENLDGVIALAVKEGRDTLWDKTRSALQYVYNYHFNDADWFLKADDDSYIIMENLRYVLYQYRPETSLYLGHRYASKNAVDGYMAGGGYVLSKKALEKFVTRLMHEKNKCRQYNEGAEDIELGLCFQNETLFIDERDELLQKRFFPAGIYEHFNKRNENNSYWYDQMLYYDSKYGDLSCCSDTSIGFHYVKPEEMYYLDYLIYNVHPFGVNQNLTEKLPEKISMHRIIKNSEVESNATNFVSHPIFHNFDKEEIFR